MSCKVLILLALIALGRANDCGEERAKECLDGLLAAVVNSAEQTEVCRELRVVSECLRDAAEECLTEEEQQEVEEQLQDLEEMLGDECPYADYDSDDEAEACLESNKDYIMECMPIGTNKALALLGDRIDDPNLAKCTVYSVIVECALERTLTRCGKEVRDRLEEEVAHPPKEIKDACEASSGSHLVHVIPLSPRRK